ncbi:hypothetical protein [Sorangium sp. So ce131]|uniref:hypothetical protein n=1 Tax=Sorangium sp. So ce131 TaxID=3133282 RepID=UPI003F5F89D9
MTNHALFTKDPASFVSLKVFVDDRSARPRAAHALTEESKAELFNSMALFRIAAASAFIRNIRDRTK